MSNVKRLAEIIVGVGYGSEEIGRYEDKLKGPKSRTADLWARLRGYTDGTYSTQVDKDKKEDNAKIIEDLIIKAITDDGWIKK